MHQGLSGLFDLVWLQYPSSARKTHSPSTRACSPSTRTANSRLGLKKPTLRPWYTIYYYIQFLVISLVFFFSFFALFTEMEEEVEKILADGNSRPRVPNLNHSDLEITKDNTKSKIVNKKKQLKSKEKVSIWGILIFMSL